MKVSLDTGVSFLDRRDECPGGHDVEPGSPFCMKCRSFMRKHWRPLVGTYEVECQWPREKVMVVRNERPE